MEFQVKTEELGDIEVIENEDADDVSPEKGFATDNGTADGHEFGKYTVKYCQGQYLWKENRVFDMIKLYKEYTDKNSLNPGNKKPMWEYIAGKMRDMGHEKCTSNHVHNKYKTLTRQYRVVCDHNAIPGNVHREFPFYDVMAEVYQYTPNKYMRIDDVDSDNESPSGQKLTSWLVNINKDKKEQEGKKLEKLESMHREKMDMFSSFLKTISKKHTESPAPTRCSKRRITPSRKRAAATSPPPPPSDDELMSDDSDVDDEFSLDQERLTSMKQSAKKQIHSNSKVNKMADQCTSELTSLITKMNDDRKARDEMKMCRLEKMHDEKMKMFLSFLDVIKKMKK